MHSRKKKAEAFLSSQGLPKNEDERFAAVYTHMKCRLGMIDVTPDPYPDPETGLTGAHFAADVGREDLLESLINLTSIGLKYLGGGLFSLGERTFSAIRRQSERKFMNYKDMVVAWRGRVWKNARNIDGEEFDAYVVNVVPHAEMVKRIQAVEAIHKLLGNISGIYNAPIPKNGIDWSTPECDKAIAQLEKIGVKAKNLDMLNTISKQYAQARKKQPLYLHGYTPKRIMDLMNRCEKLAEYGDPRYIKSFEEKYLGLSDKTEELETKADEKEMEYTSSENGITEKEKKEVMEMDNEAKIKAARLWWLAHFLKAAYAITVDILEDVERLSVAVERTISKEAS